jgi:hypothetical protein
MIRIDEPVHRMEIACDKEHCPVSIRVDRATREECNLELYRAGWCLYKGKQYCATHHVQLAKRLRSKK